MSAVPAAPVPILPTLADMKGDPKRLQVYEGVKEALQALPSMFTTETHIDGVLATDIQNLNAVLGALIEDQVVEALNRLRNYWDPNNDFGTYSFIRQSQRFPDVLLRHASTDDVILGMELKGWYLLAKEGEPSFRFFATPAVCAPADLFVVVPWVLSNVISGTPKVYAPYIESAKFAAEYRNHWWEFIREAKSDPTIVLAQNVGPYPAKSDAISDRPASDPGGNFGRFARTKIMDGYISVMDEQPIRGVKARYWRDFFTAFVDQKASAVIENRLQALYTKIQKEVAGEPTERQESALRLIAELEKLLAEVPDLGIS
jgi:hypothetical protein